MPNESESQGPNPAPPSAMACRCAAASTSATVAAGGSTTLHRNCRSGNANATVQCLGAVMVGKGREHAGARHEGVNERGGGLFKQGFEDQAREPVGEGEPQQQFHAAAGLSRDGDGRQGPVPFQG